MSHPATRRALIAAALAALACLAPAHAMYKWVDEKGVTHYSEHPPPDGRKATRVEPKVAAPPQGAPAEDWREREQRSRHERLEREQREQAEKSKAERAEAERRQRCLRSQRALDLLQRQVPVYSVDEKGQRVYLDDKSREAEIAQHRRQVEAACGR